MRPLFRALHALAFAAGTSASLSAQQQPPRRLDFTEQQPSSDTVARVRGETTREMRTAFVRSQTVLGLTVYGPAFATMIGDDGISATAGYLVMAGGSFFVATELTRQLEITTARQHLSSRMAWRGALNGLVLGSSLDLGGRQTAGLTWLTAVGGTATGLAVARDMSAGEAVAMVVGHDIAFLSSLAVFAVVDPTNDGISGDARGIGATLAGWGGYYVGRRYALRAPYEVTSGDALLLWNGATIGVAALSTFIVDGDPSQQAAAGTALLGAYAGLWGADRWLVRKFDHTAAEGALVSLGATAGALMGIGIGVLIVGEAERGAAMTLGFGAAGAVGGMWMTERYAAPAPDGGARTEVGRVQFNPLGAVAAANKVPGQHPILRITF